jgi:hypothetical protein
MSATERQPDDGKGEYSPREMLGRAEVRHGPALRGNTNEVEISEGEPKRCIVYAEQEQEAWISSTLYINRGNLR